MHCEVTLRAITVFEDFRIVFTCYSDLGLIQCINIVVKLESTYSARLMHCVHDLVICLYALPTHLVSS